MLKDFPARGPASTRNAAAVPSNRSVTGSSRGRRVPRLQAVRPSGRGRGGPTETGRTRRQVPFLAPSASGDGRLQGGRTRTKASAGVR